MPDKKLTDNEIVKALECCTYEPKRHCIECPNNEDILRCALRLKIEAFDLINRLQAENDNLKNDELPKCKDALRRANEIGMELQAENERLSQFGGILLRNGSELFKEIQTAKVEAYKEFAEKSNSIIDSLLEKYSIADFEEFKVICQTLRGLKNDTNNLLKELVGEDNA